MYPRGALARVDSRAASRYAGGHMIKRMEFATRRRDVTLATFAESWRDVVSGRAEAPRPVRPRHIALKLALVGEAPVSKHGGVSVEVDDRSHLERFEEWRRHDRHLVDPPGGLGGRRGGQPGGPGERGRPARRRVARRARWRQGGTKLEHMAMARRSRPPDTGRVLPTLAERRQRGARPSETRTTAVPDEARGLAYVQNHPLHRVEGEWAHDAINRCPSTTRRRPRRCSSSSRGVPGPSRPGSHEGTPLRPAADGTLPRSAHRHRHRPVKGTVRVDHDQLTGEPAGHPSSAN